MENVKLARSKAKHVFGLGDAFQHHFGNSSWASLSSPGLQIENHP
jgi:hypothetical protein